MSDKNAPKVEGRVEEALPGTTFKISMPDGKTVLGHLSGKMRLHYIKIIPGDRVLMELSPDGSRARIVRRL